MMDKRARPDSVGPFESRKYAADILRGNIDSPGSYIEGCIFSMNPRKNHYTVDIRLDSKARTAYLNVFIEERLQKRLELNIGDHLRISLRGAQLLPYSGPPSHVPAILRFREGITILLVSRPSLQGEKEKLFHVWPGSNANAGKVKKRKPNCDISDVGWFSSPPPGNGHPGIEQSLLGSRSNTAGGSMPSPNHTGLPAEPSTATGTLQTSRKSPPATGKSQGAATYAYRSGSSHRRSTPVHLAISESSSAAGSTVLAPPMLRQTSSEVDQRSAPLSRGSSESRNGDSAAERPPLGKQKSSRKKKREELKRRAALAAAVLPAVTDSSSTPTEITLAAPTTIDTGEARADTSQGDNSKTNLNPSAPSMSADTSPEQLISAELGVQEAGLAEDVDSTRRGAEIEPSDEDPALGMRAGLIVNGWPYTAISEIRVGALMSIIGVVTSVNKEPAKSQTGDWCTCFSLLDPSILDSFGGVLYTASAGIKINCFMRVERWLPNAKRGDVVLLRQVKIVKWQDSVTGTCYANTMQWAIYDPVTEEVSQPDPDIAGHRSHHPPTWHVAQPEKEYCAQLASWWAAVQRARAERQGTAVQIGGGPIIAAEKKQSHRQHLLISEADPGREPRGYFNCTVEILHGHANHVSDIYSIYVTDYTSKTGTFMEHSSEWCPASLANRVLRIEMWRDKAVALAQQMKPGEYWSLDNVRMKVSNGGYIEGSFSEAAKARKLSIADVDTSHHLQALLQRKKVWEENDANPHVFPHKLFSEVELQSIFDCTVEVLHAEYTATGTSMAYMTDYTERGDLATPPTALWSRRLPGRIVTLELQGQQSKMAEKMESGGFFVVKHMRLIERIMGVGKVVGRIGGPDRLIHKLNASSPNEELERLLERKKQWEEEEPTTAKRTEGFTTIAHVLKSRGPVDKFRIRAHVVGTFPLRLKDCVVRRCKSCSEEVPKSTDACPACMVSDGEAPGWENMFHLFLRLQDEHGHAQITVAVDQNSSVLNGLTPDDVIGASGSAEMVRERLANYIGNLEAVQVASSQGRTLATKVPIREFTIESWYVEEEEEEGDGRGVIAYGLA